MRLYSVPVCLCMCETKEEIEKKNTHTHNGKSIKIKSDCGKIAPVFSFTLKFRVRLVMQSAVQREKCI